MLYEITAATNKDKRGLKNRPYFNLLCYRCNSSCTARVCSQYKTLLSGWKCFFMVFQAASEKNIIFDVVCRTVDKISVWAIFLWRWIWNYVHIFHLGMRVIIVEQTTLVSAKRPECHFLAFTSSACLGTLKNTLAVLHLIDLPSVCISFNYRPCLSRNQTETIKSRVFSNHSIQLMNRLGKQTKNFLQSLKGETNWACLQEIIFPKDEVRMHFRLRRKV